MTQPNGWSPYAILTVVVIGGAAFGVGFVTQHLLKAAYFYQTWAPETVLFACGLGFSWPAVVTTSLLDFLTLKTTSFDCGQLAGIETLPPQPFVWNAPWLYLATGLSWKFFGISQTALAPLLGAFHAFYAIGAFVLARLYFPVWAAALVSAALTFSPIAISLLLLLRDYSKAPFILWAVIALIYLVRARGTQAGPGYAFLLGIMLAFGAGFRDDVWVLGPVIVCVLLMVILSPRQSVGLRIATFTTFALPLALGLSPQITHPAPAPMSSVVLQGTTVPFDRHLKLATAGYDLGHRYSDELTMSAMVADIDNLPFFDNSQARRWESLQGAELVRLANAAAVKKYVLNFPADIVTRAMKAVVLVVGFYPLLTADSLAEDPGRPPYPVGYWLPQLGAYLIEKLAFPALPLVVFPGLMFLLAGIFSRSPAEGLVVALVFISLTASPSLQFSIRHFFHLEWIPWFGILGYLYVPDLWAKNRALLFKVGLAVFVFAAIAAVVRAGLGIYQSKNLIEAAAALVEGGREHVPATAERLKNGSVEIAVSVPEAHRTIITAPPDYLSEMGPIRPPPPDVRIVAAADRLLVQIGGPGCLDQTMQIGTVYHREPAAWQDLKREIEVRTSSKPEDRVMVLLPVFYRPTQWFTGLHTSSQALPCISSIDRLVTPTSLPTLFAAVLEPGWQNRPMMLGLGRL